MFRKTQGLMRSLLMIAMVALLAACGSSDNDQKGSAVVETVPQTRLPSGLVDRPGLPPLHDGQVAACVPRCTNGRGVPDIPVGAYQTRWFFGGYMTLTFDTVWTPVEDSAGEFKVRPEGDDDYGVSLTLDNYPVREGTKVAGVPRTVAGWVRWHERDPRLIVSKPQTAKFGSLRTTAIDVRLSRKAGQEHADCPAACVDLWGNDKFDHANGILGNDVYRLYLADVRYSGSRHLFIVIVEGRDAAHLARFAPKVEHLLQSVKLPVAPGD
jgi:hypothetical protein